MKMIAAADNKWGIGKDNELLVHIPGDLKYFKEKTMGKVVVMGLSCGMQRMSFQRGTL